MKHLLIVESPAKARTIAQYLGDGFEVMASYGHIRDLPTKELAIDVNKNYEVKYTIIPKARKVIKELKDALEKSDSLYLATDPDREGEAIAWHLVEALKCQKPIRRIVFHEITKSAIEQAIRQPKDISGHLVDSQQARRILDRLVGYKLSPLLWEKVYRGLSAGRVQSAAVRLIVERDREIKNFKAREYWTLEAVLKAAAGEFEAYLSSRDSLGKLELANEKEADKLMKLAKSVDLQVDDLDIKPSFISPPPPLITSTLQQSAASNLGFSAKKTMKLAQDLYEGVDIQGGGPVALITYMRTDSYQMSNEAVQKVRVQIEKRFGAKYLPEKPNVFTKKVRGAQEAHEAIRPTNFEITPQSLEGKISKDHFKLYRIIYQNALASQMAKARVETTTAISKITDQYRFIAKGRKLLFEGFLAANPISEERFQPLVNLNKGEKLSIKSLKTLQHFTEPPAHYSEASLVKELERLGIGRPSTYAPIMSTIVERGYVVKQGGRFQSQDVAEVVTDLLVEHFPNIVDYHFTAQVEKELDDIAEGEKNLVEVVDHFYRPFEKLLQEKTKTIDKKELLQEKTEKKCPQCRSDLVIKLGRHGRFLACESWPKCDYTAPLLNEFDTEEKKEIGAQIKEKCPKCKSELKIKEGRFGAFIGCINYPKCDYTNAITITAQIKCPNCQGDIIRKRTRKGRIFWGCAGYPKCRTAFWNEPVDKKCPKCQSVVVKNNGEFLRCSQCQWEEKLNNG